MARTLPQHQPQSNTPVGDLRTRAGLSQTDAIRLTGFTRTGWHVVERGHTMPQPAKFRAICRAFKCTPEELLLAIARTPKGKWRKRVQGRSKKMLTPGA